MHWAERELAELADRLADVERYEPRLVGFFAGAGELWLARAPGRLDVMGGIADYSGALVLEQPLRESARVAVARTGDELVRVASRGSALRVVTFPAQPLFEACATPASARAYFAAQPREHAWAAYTLGGLVTLRQRGVALQGGLRLLVDSLVPEGKGVSSSAALEVASLRALGALWGQAFSGPELGLACQRVENEVVGAPCGVMDQMTSACGEEGKLLCMLCQPAELRGSLAVPEGLALFGIDSGLRHSVGGADYSSVRVAAFMGLRILAERLGARVVPLGQGRVALEGDPLAGYLANLTREQLTPELLAALPERVSGAEFLKRFAGISDTVTRVDATASYMVRAATLHPINEHARVVAFERGLGQASNPADLAELGQLMFESHESYGACGLGSDATDELVARARREPEKNGIGGAKITGAGSGGTVVILARHDAQPQVLALAEAYASATGREARVFAGSSPGALATPVLEKKLTRKS